MKKTFLWSMAMLMMALLTTSCAETKLKAGISEANKKCPVSLGLTGEITSVSYEGDVVEMLFTLDEQFANIDALSANAEESKSAILTNMKGEDTKKLFDLLIEAGADFDLVLRGKTSGKEFRIKLTPEELKQELEKPMPTDEEKLQAAIASTNRRMPVDTGSGIVMTQLVDRGDAVIYMATVADADQFKLIAKSKESVKASQLTMFKMLGPAEKQFFMLVANAGKNLGYVYSLEGSEETIEMIHTNAELKSVLGL